MLKIIQFEVKKILRSMYSFIMIIILLLSISVFFVYSYVNTVSKEILAEGEEELEFMDQHAIDKLKKQIEDDPSLADSYTIKSKIEHHKKFRTKHRKEKEALLNEDWIYISDQQVEFLKDQVAMVSDKYYPYRNMSRWPSDFTLQVHYHRSIWLRDNNIHPLFSYHYTDYKTAYDLTFSDPLFEELLQKDSNKYSPSSVHFVYDYFRVVYGAIGVSFFLFLFGDIYTKEGPNRYGSIHFLYTQPISRRKVIVCKFIATLCSTLVIIIGSALFSVLLGIVFDRFGAWNYPILIYQPEESFYFMPILSFIGIATLLFFMILVFCYSLLFFFSVITKRTVLAIGFTFGVILLGMMFSVEADTSFATYNPFHYLQVYDIISMEFAVVQKNFNMIWTNGLVTLGITSGMLWVGIFGIEIIQRNKI